VGERREIGTKETTPNLTTGGAEIAGKKTFPRQLISSSWELSDDPNWGGSATKNMKK